MTISVANTANTNTVKYWRTRTNELADAMTNSVVTAGGGAAVGNAVVTGTVQATTLAANAIGGGTATSPDVLTVTTNTTFQAKVTLGNGANVHITTGNSTFRVLTVNSADSFSLRATKLTFADNSDTAISAPSDGQVLTYDAGTSTWKNQDSAVTGVIPDASLQGAYTHITSLTVGNSTVKSVVNSLGVVAQEVTVSDTLTVDTVDAATLVTVGSNILVNTTVMAVGSTTNVTVNAVSVRASNATTGSTLTRSSLTVGNSTVNSSFGQTSASVGSVTVNATALVVANTTSNTLFVAANGNIGVGTSSPAFSLSINDTDGVQLPSGNTGTRPGSPVAGLTRFNTTLNVVEFYDGSQWISTSPVIYAQAKCVFYGANGGFIGSAVNVSGVTRLSAGEYLVSFTNPLPDANYAVIATGQWSGVHGDRTVPFISYYSPNTTTVHIHSQLIDYAASSTQTNALDPVAVSMVVY